MKLATKSAKKEPVKATSFENVMQLRAKFHEAAVKLIDQDLQSWDFVHSNNNFRMWKFIKKRVRSFSDEPRPLEYREFREFNQEDLHFNDYEVWGNELENMYSDDDYTTDNDEVTWATVALQRVLIEETIAMAWQVKPRWRW